MQLVYKAAAIAIVPWLCRLLRSQACSFAPSLHFAAAAKFTTFRIRIFTWTDKRNCALHWIYKGPWEITAPWLFQAVYGKTAVFIGRCALNTIRCGRTRCYSGPFYKLAESVNQRSGVRPCVCPWVSLTGLCQINYRSVYGTDLHQIFVVSVEFWLFFIDASRSCNIQATWVLYHRLMIFAIFDLSPLSLWMNGILRVNRRL